MNATYTYIVKTEGEFEEDDQKYTRWFTRYTSDTIVKAFEWAEKNCSDEWFKVEVEKDS